jgi:hypothetical protein
MRLWIRPISLRGEAAKVVYTVLGWVEGVERR